MLCENPCAPLSLGLAADATYLKWPEGMVEHGFMSPEEVDEYCIAMDKATYGIADAPSQSMEQDSHLPSFSRKN